MSNKINTRHQTTGIRLQTSDSKWWFDEKTLLFIIGFIAVISFVNTLNNPFTFDDKLFFTENGYIKKLSNVSLLFSDKYLQCFNEINYRPIYTLSLILNYAMSKLDVFWWRLVNIFLHLVNTLLVYFLVKQVFQVFNNQSTRELPPSSKLRRTFTNPGTQESNYLILSIISAILFAVHPVHTEVINVIAYRTELLSCLFFILSLLFYIKSIPEKKPGFGPVYILSVLMFILALLSKQTAAVLPIIIFLYHYFYGRLKKKDLLIRLMPYVIVLVLCVLLPNMILESRVIYKDANTLNYSSNLGSKVHLRTLGAEGAVVLRYTWLSLVPVRQVLNYPLQLSGWNLTSGEMFSFIILFIILFLAFKLRKTNKDISFSIFFFYVSLLPVSQIIPFSMLYAERWLYIPSIGACLFLSLVFEKYFRKTKLKTVVLVLAGMLVLFYFSLTVSRNKQWSNLINILQQDRKIFPRSMYPYLFLSDEYMFSRSYSSALENINLALKMYPDEYMPYYNLGVYYINTGLPSKAVLTFTIISEKFSKRAATSYKFYLKSGEAYRGIKDYEKSVQCFLKSWSIYPYDRQIYNELGIMYYEKGDYEQSVKTYIQALEIDPDWIVPMHNLVLAYQKLKSTEKADNVLKKIYSLYPEYPKVGHKNVVWTSGQYEAYKGAYYN